MWFVISYWKIFLEITNEKNPDINKFRADYTVTGVHFFANLHTQRGCMWPIFLKIPWVDKTWNMLIIRMQSQININFSVQFKNISNLNIQMYLH